MDGFLETTEWINLSSKIRKRDQQCLRCGSKYRLCADHIIPRSRRRDLSLAEFNLQTLCWNCNKAKKNRYIVSFLDNPSEKLLNEIEHEKLKMQIALNKIAKNRIYKDKTDVDGFVKKEDFIKAIEGYNIFTLGINHPKQAEREGVFHQPLNVLRFFGMGFSLMGGVALSILQEANDQYGKSKISEKEISEFIETELNKIFLDWEDFGQKNYSNKNTAKKNFQTSDKAIKDDDIHYGEYEEFPY